MIEEQVSQCPDSGAAFKYKEQNFATLCNKSELFPILQVNICLLFVGGLHNIFGDDFFFLGRSPHNPSQVSLFTLRASPLHPTKGVQMALWQSQFLGFIKTYPRHHLFPLHHTTSILKKPNIECVGRTILLTCHPCHSHCLSCRHGNARCKSWKSKEGEEFCGNRKEIPLHKHALHFLGFNCQKWAKKLSYMKAHSFTLQQQQAYWLWTVLSSLSLETKWSLIKHDVFNFCDNFEVVRTLNENVVCSGDVHQKVLKL